MTLQLCISTLLFGVLPNRKRSQAAVVDKQMLCRRSWPHDAASRSRVRERISAWSSACRLRHVQSSRPPPLSPKPPPNFPPMMFPAFPSKRACRVSNRNLVLETSAGSQLLSMMSQPPPGPPKPGLISPASMASARSTYSCVPISGRSTYTALGITTFAA